MSQFALMAIVAIFSSNIVSVAGIGAISLQAEKKNFGYMLASTVCVALSVLVTGLIYKAVDQFLLARFNAEFLKLFVVVLLALIIAFLTKALLKFVSKEIYFLYEKSYSLAIQSAITVGTMFIIDFSAGFMDVMFMLAVYCVGFFLVQILFYALYDRLDNSSVLKPARNVPLMLIALSIVSMILCTVGMFF